jgi:hypothetical protein
MDFVGNNNNIKVGVEFQSVSHDTRVEWSRVEWSGVEWSGVESSRVESSRV